MKKIFSATLLGISPWLVLVFCVAASLFYFNPQWDINTTALFYDETGRFYLRERWWASFVYRGVHIATFVLILLYLFYLVASYFRNDGRLWGITRKSIVYMAVVLIIGPGIVVNWGLKDQVGRARPADTICFGGDQQFTPAFVFSKECDNNCSFVSGHASFGFYWIVLAFLAATPLRRGGWAAFAVLFGGSIGLVRIMQGRHYLSDVIFAFFFVYFVAGLVYWFMYRRKEKPFDAEV